MTEENNNLMDIIICQDLIDDYRHVMKEYDYVLLCNNMQKIYNKLQMNDIRLRRYQSSYINNFLDPPETNGDCVVFLLNLMRYLIFIYSIILIIIAYRTF